MRNYTIRPIQPVPRPRALLLFTRITCVLVLALLTSSSTAFGGLSAKLGQGQRWLLIGPFPNKGYNGFYREYVKLWEDERELRPREGDSIVTGPGRVVYWKEAWSDERGFVGAGKFMPQEKKGIAYAYTVLPSDGEVVVAATFGFSGSLQVRLNGTVVHELRISRKPEPDKDVVVLRLKKGNNTLLVKVEGTQPHWGFFFNEYRPSSGIFVNEVATIVPDFRLGEPLRAWGQVEVANATTDSLCDVVVEIVGTRTLLPSRTSSEILRPGMVQRIPVWMATTGAITDSIVEPVQLKISSGKDQRLVQFTPRVRRRNEYFVATYRSGLDGSVQPYSLLLPAGFDPGVAYPLALILHGAWVTDWGQNIVSYDSKDWIIQAAVHDRGNNRYRDIGEVDLLEVLNEVKRRYRIDEDRIFLAGHSMGGYGTWFQAVRHPHRWVAISPQAGYADYFLYHPAMSDGRGISEFRMRLLEEWSPLLFVENLLHVPSYVVHGAKDDNVVVEHSRRMAARLKELNYTFVYDENPDAGHWWGPRGATYGMEVVDKPAIWEFLREHSPRKKNPNRVLYKTNTLRYSSAYWVSIDELDTVYSMAQIDARIVEQNVINVTSNNITQFTIRLNDTLVNTQLPVRVTVNGRLTFDEFLPRSSNLTLRTRENGNPLMVLTNDDLAVPPVTGPRGWSIAGELDQGGRITRFMQLNDEPLKKAPALFGPVVDAFNSQFLFVVGASGSNEDLLQAIRQSAERIARNWEAHANGIIRMKNDCEITPADIAGNNLVLLGDEISNAVLGRINNRLPIRWLRGKIVIEKEAYTGEGIGMVMVYPNPLNPAKYIVVIGGTTPLSFDLAARIPLPEVPDYVLFDRHSFETEESRFRASGFFDKYWKLTSNGRDKKTMRDSF